MTTDPEHDDDVGAGGDDGPEPIASAPVIVSEEHDDELIPISTTPMYRTGHPGGRHSGDVEYR
jgi:hypothetical protein